MDLDLQQIAVALDGPPALAAPALRELADRDVDGRLARRHRVSGALALRASRLGVDGGPALEAWRGRLRAVSAQQMHLESALAEVAEALGDVPWTPIKGMDLGSRTIDGERLYEAPEERPTSDLDVLVSARDFDRARAQLESAGWTSLYDGPRGEAYLREEGYAWQARGPRGALLELHYRLWGLVDEGAAAAFWDASTDDPSLPGAGRRLRLADAYLVAAVHLWLDPPPRPAGAFRDLFRLGLHVSSAEIVEEAERLDLQLPVYLAADAVRRAWSWEGSVDKGSATVAQDLRPILRAAERLGLGDDPASKALSSLVLRRHLARRRARHGLGRVLLRRLWAHPGIVENASDSRRPWIARRIWYQLLTHGFPRAARFLERRFHLGAREPRSTP